MAFAMLDSGRRYTTADIDLVRDVADRTAIALDNRSLYREIQERDRRKDEFLAMLAHELRNPLAADQQRGSAVLEKLGRADDDRVGSDEVIGRQVHHLARLVDDLLDVVAHRPGEIIASSASRSRSATWPRRSIQAFEAAAQDRASTSVALETDAAG